MTATYSPGLGQVRTAAPTRERSAFDLPDVISAALVPLMVAASLGGLLIDSLYRDNAWAREANRGNDVATLAVGVPILVVSLLLARRGSVHARLVWFGMVAFNVYNYAFYLFAVSFNKFFLVYATLTTASLITLVLAASHMSGRARLADGARVRLVGGYMCIVGGMFAVLWTIQSLQFAATGELPTLLTNAQIPTNPVFALDFTLIIPGFLIGAGLLLRRHAWGLVLGVVMNVLGFVYMVALTFGGGFQSNAGIADSTWIGVPWVPLALTSVVATVLVLRQIQPQAGQP